MTGGTAEITSTCALFFRKQEETKTFSSRPLSAAQKPWYCSVCLQGRAKPPGMSPPAPSLAHLDNPAASPFLKQGFITACIRLLPFQPNPPAVVRRMLPSLPLLVGGSAEAEGQTGRADGQAEVQVGSEWVVEGSCSTANRMPSQEGGASCSSAHTFIGHAQSVCPTALSTCAGDRHGCGLHSKCGVGRGGARAALPAGARKHSLLNGRAA